MPRSLRVALSLWVVLVMKDGVWAFEPNTERFPGFAGLRRRSVMQQLEDEPG